MRQGEGSQHVGSDGAHEIGPWHLRAGSVEPARPVDGAAGEHACTAGRGPVRSDLLILVVATGEHGGGQHFHTRGGDRRWGEFVELHTDEVGHALLHRGVRSLEQPVGRVGHLPVGAGSGAAVLQAHQFGFRLLQRRLPPVHRGRLRVGLGGRVGGAAVVHHASCRCAVGAGFEAHVAIHSVGPEEGDVRAVVEGRHQRLAHRG